MPIRLGVRLVNYLMDTPGMGIELEHFLVAVFGNEKVRPPPVIKNVHVLEYELDGLVERRDA